jgi:hypothetical protein
MLVVSFDMPPPLGLPAISGIMPGRGSDPPLLGHQTSKFAGRHEAMLRVKKAKTCAASLDFVPL